MTLRPDDRAEARILAIAADHIRRFGMNRLTIVAIAEQAGMSHANVYRFFRSKAALIEACIGDWLRALELAVSDIAQSPDPADDKLERFLLALGKAYRDRLETDAAMFDAFVTLTARRAGIVTLHRSRIRKHLERIIDEGMEPGPFASGEAGRAHALVVDAMQRFTHPVLVRETRDLPRRQNDHRLEALAKVVVRALRQGKLS